MLHKTIQLSEKYPGATLTTYISDDPPELKMPPRRAIVVCPGGGYHFLSEREAEPIVKMYLAAGLNVFLLRYTVGAGAANYAPLIQASLAIKHVREHAEEYNIDPNYVFITGFSAGGHLAASTGTLWNIPEVLAAMGDAPLGINRPTGMVLCYAVLIFSHKKSFWNLCGTEQPTPEQLERFELEKHVSPDTPPTFLWHTFTDKTVDVQNALTFAQKLKDNGVPFELHIYPEGDHGLSLSNEQTWSQKPNMIMPHTEGWIELAIKWIKDFK
ncbi:MAG: alpha/beta hydrolase [Clostridia bacterium]|nr:alpha/beta hydrolase [Clostridia bacterium]